MSVQDLVRDVSLASGHAATLPKLAVALARPTHLRLLARNLVAAATGGLSPRSLDPQEMESRIRLGLGWIGLSQDIVGSGGVGCNELRRWTPGYPEVTGYIIPTMWRAYGRSGDGRLADRARSMSEWELGLQRADGGWEGCYEGDGKPSVVFNTAQVVRGMVATYQQLGDQRFLDSAVRAADWIVASQDDDGSWSEANFKKMKRVYDTYTCAPLAMVYTITGDEAYREAIDRNVAFVAGHQLPNGWFELADNIDAHCDAPVTHTISYTIDGLLECGDLLGDDAITKLGRYSADAILDQVDDGWLAARYDQHWSPRSRAVCNTGSAQLGLIAMRLHRETGDQRYRSKALELAGYVAAVQDLNDVGPSTRGAIAGSFPIWGTYCPMKFPCWATKYFVDLLLDLTEERATEERSDGSTGKVPRRFT